MTLHWKLVVDAADPHAQAVFWAAALGYEVEDNAALIDQLIGVGALPEEETVAFQGRRAFRDLIGVRHPDDPVDERTGAGLGRRVLFQRVPETKTVKNRLHMDVHADQGRRDAEAERITGLGARVVERVKSQGGEWIVMTDPEGNEFCVC